jgi:acyl dehydratase
VTQTSVSLTHPLPPLNRMVGQVIGTSDWLAVDQARIDAFADVTEDWQFIHTDPARAALGPFGGTIAHGFLTLSLLSRMAETALPWLAGAGHSVNAGFDRVRFLAPVHAGARLRAVFTLTGAEERADGALRLSLGVQVEIDGQDRPALVADWVVMLWQGGAT